MHHIQNQATISSQEM